jgi:hypothetical protein
VVASYSWDYVSLGATDAGAVTWGNGTTGISGAVSAANSLVGGAEDGLVGVRVKELANGSYVVIRPGWDSGSVTNVGAITWSKGVTGITGSVSAANSLVGSTSGVALGDNDVTVLTNGDYVVVAPYWDNGSVANTGSVTWGSLAAGVTGPVTARNSVLGTAESCGLSMVWTYDGANKQLVVGRPMDNTVTLFKPSLNYSIFLPGVVKGAP